MDKHVYVEAARPGRPEEAEAAVEALLERLPAMRRLTADSHVLLKPNLLRKNAPEKAVTTHPDVVRAVVLALHRRGVRNITLADSPGGPYTPAAMRGVYAGCGLAALCEELGVALYTECESDTVPAARVPGGVCQSFTMLRPVLQADFIINLPKLKTHVLTGMSGAVKNLFGCVPGLQKAEFHMRFPRREDFVRMLVDLCQTVRADVHLVDGIIGMEGDGPGSGTPRACGFLLAGEDPYAVDLALCEYMGMEPQQVPVMAAANAAGLCALALESGQLRGAEAVAWPAKDYKLPASYGGRMDFSSSVPKPLRGIAAAVAAKTAPRPAVDKKACVGCGKCAQICPQQVIRMEQGKAKISYRECIRCFCCHEICPEKAIDVRRFGIYNM